MIQIIAAKDGNITLQLSSTSFAKVKFDAAAPLTTASNSPDVAPELLHAINANQLRVMYTAFDKSVNRPCSYCSGTGKITVTVQTGVKHGGTFADPIYSTHEENCPHCNGKGVIHGEEDAIIQQANILVKGMASVNPDDPDAQSVLSDTYAVITRDMIGDRPTWVALTAHGKSILAQRSPQAGSVIVSLVEVEKSEKTPDHRRRYLVRVIGTDRKIYVDNPALA